jgi:hypothetical protein
MLKKYAAIFIVEFIQQFIDIALLASDNDSGKLFSTDSIRIT